MKKHLIYSINVLFALIIILTINSCRKETPNFETKLSTKSLDLISEAKLHFDNNLKEAPSDRGLSGNEEKNKFQLLGKKVLWEYAKVKKMAVGESVRVPIFYDEENFIKAGKEKKSMSLYNLSYLMMYKDKKGKMQTEWVITIPDDDYVDRKRNSGIKFTGVIYVLDWKGNLIKSYSYKKDGSVLMGKEMTFSKQNNLKVASQDEQIKLNDYWINGCYTTYLWDCGPVSSGIGVFCQRIGVTTCYNIRVVEPAGKELPVSEGGGGGGPSDYTPDEPDCPVSGNPENPTPPLIGERSISTDSDNCEEDKDPDLNSDCYSWNFKAVGPSGYLSAGVNNIDIDRYDAYVNSNGELILTSESFTMPTLYYEMPDRYTPGQAASQCAILTDLAEDEYELIYRNKPPLGKADAEIAFLKILNSFFHPLGGRVVLQFNYPNIAIRNISKVPFGNGNCL